MKLFFFRNFTKVGILAIFISFGIFAGLEVGFASDPTSSGAHVFTTEAIPGADCKAVDEAKNKNVETRKFDCTVPEASSAIKSVISTMIQYVVFIATLCGVLMLAVGGIMYSIGGATDEGKVKAKKFIVSSIAGLILLFFVSAILYLVAPWVYS
ncbi:MAG: hypothetical protein U0518_01035 [Candidatus Gracilibacteria bacterium]